MSQPIHTGCGEREVYVINESNSLVCKILCLYGGGQ